VEDLEIGNQSDNDVIRVEENIDLNLPMASLKHNDAIKLKRDTAISGETLVSKAYHAGGSMS